ALGVIRIILENSIRLSIARVLWKPKWRLAAAVDKTVRLVDLGPRDSPPTDPREVALEDNLISGLLSFFADRLKVQLREQGARHDLVDAVFALEGQDDLLLIVRRVEALGQFLDTDDGKNLLAGYKRATNIIRIEEKKDAREYRGPPDPARYAQAEERALAGAIEAARREAQAAVAREDFAAAMTAMATL